ncbi:FAD-dependent oxidoreductase [Kitasatospora sp. NPDC059646]|uniref:FAD-dependent oxidoreductase n=1 Tax=Kitasatospora sp. NPDC059646 TaxID=3346893 RepID=UPI0036AC6E43
MPRTAPATEIGIVGGGPAGLTLARLLTVRGTPVTVHERDAGPDARTQGGTLDLRPDTGQRALRAAGLTEAFARHARPEGQDMLLYDRSGTLLYREDTPDPAPGDAPSPQPEIDRADLRTLLLGSLPPGTVRWGHALRDAAPAPGGGWRLRFDDGSTAEHRILIGADGARSRLRPLLTPAEPHHLGVNSVEGTVPAIDRTHPDLAAAVGRGTYWVIGDGDSFAAQRCTDGRVRIGLSLRGPADWPTTCGIPFDRPAEARAALLELFADWPPTCRALLAASEGELTPRPFTALPVGLRWPHRPGLTLLGDAAHLMPPVGLGANAAMRDALELADALAAHPGDRGSALRAYEDEMFARTAEDAARSDRMIRLIHSPGGARGVAAFFAPDGPAAGDLESSVA